MSKTPKRNRKPSRHLNAAELQAEHTRRALQRGVLRARAIARLSKQLQRANDVAQRALLDLAGQVALGEGFEMVAVQPQKAVNE